MTTSLVLVVVPAHDEQDEVGACLDALAVAAAHPALAGVEVRTLVVLDACTDGTAGVCAARGVTTVAVPHRDVGRARADGIRALTATLRGDPRLAGAWVATTDADTTVAPDWLAAQLQLADNGADAVLGVVDLDAPSAAFTDLYVGADGPGPHPHVHGACLGVSLAAYERVGGFRSRAVGEDQDLADRLAADPAVRVARSTAVRVKTSSRLASRVRGGFADLLAALHEGRPVPAGQVVAGRRSPPDVVHPVGAPGNGAPAAERATSA